MKQKIKYMSLLFLLISTIISKPNGISTKIHLNSIPKFFMHEIDTSIKKIKILQHAFSFGIVNSNINWFQWEPNNYLNNRPFKSDVITDFQWSYNLNIKGFEIEILNKYIPNTFPFGTKDIVFFTVGYNRRYHHDFLLGFHIGGAVFYRVSTPLVNHCNEIHTLPGTPCYPEYQYNKPTSIIQVNIAYKFFRNKNIILGMSIHRWLEYYDIGKTWDNANDWLVFELYLKYALYKK